MGYAAEELHRDGDLIITNPQATWDALVAFEATEPNSYSGGSGSGHISWCARLSEYKGDVATRVTNVLRDYGWEVDATVPDGICLLIWGGDKIGSCWDGVTSAIAAGVSEPCTIYMRGEDGAMWGEAFNGGTYQTADVSITLRDA